MAISAKVKRILKISGISFGVILAILIAIPYFFKDKIVAKVKEAVNKELNATVDFKDVDISLIRHFPRVSVTLKRLSVIGKEDFEGVPLLRTEGLKLVLNFWSVWNGGNPYEVNSVYLNKPYLNIIALNNGKANYDITKPTPPTEPTAFKLSLDYYEIENGHLKVDYQPATFFMDLKGLNHSGSGEMTADVYDLDTETTADSMTVAYADVQYLTNVKTVLNTLLNVDMTKFKFTLKKTDAKLNDLALNFDGWIEMPDNGDIVMDAKFGAPTNKFKDFLSILPAAYTANFSDVKANGNFALNGFVKGIYNDKVYPQFALNTTISDANFQYPSLPMSVNAINAQINVALPESNFDAFQVDVPKMHFQLGDAKDADFSLNFKLRTPVSDPNVDLTAKGLLNLADLPKAFPMESVKNLTGILNADVTIKTLMSYIDKKQYEKVSMAGALSLKGFQAKMEGYPDMTVNDMAMNFAPSFVDITNFNAKLGKSDVQGTFRIDNILAFFSTDKTMTGTSTLRSSLFDANEWLGTASSTPPSVSESAPAPQPVEKPFDRFNFVFDGKIDRLIYDKYDITNNVLIGNFAPNRLEISQFQTNIGNSDIAGKGLLTGVFDWLFENKTLGGNLNVTSNFLDLNQFMTETPQTSTTNTATEPFVVPDNVDLLISGKMGRVLYTNMDLSNISGDILMKNGEVKMQDVAMTTLGGRMTLNGAYSTAESKTEPKFKFAYNMNSVDFQQSFKTFNSFQKFAPIGEFIKGKFNSNMALEGKLGKDLMPVYQNISAAGFLQTLQAALSGFKPLEEVANRLQMNELKGLDLKDTKNWFSIENGVVKLDEFEQKVKDITLKIGGTHSLTNEMNYTIKTRIPRKRLESNAVGQAANGVLAQISGEASKFGIDIKKSEFVNLQFTITGSMSQPKVSMKVLSGDGTATATDVAQGALTQAKDTLVGAANQKLDEAKAKAKQATDRAVDSATAIANKKIEEAKERAANEARKKAEEMLGSQVGGEVGKKVESKIDDALNKTGAGDKVKSEAEKLKNKLDKFDPFGKKKKEGN